MLRFRHNDIQSHKSHKSHRAFRDASQVCTCEPASQPEREGERTCFIFHVGWRGLCRCQTNPRCIFPLPPPTLSPVLGSYMYEYSNLGNRNRRSTISIVVFTKGATPSEKPTYLAPDFFFTLVVGQCLCVGRLRSDSIGCDLVPPFPVQQHQPSLSDLCACPSTSFTLAFRAFRLAGLAVGLGLSALTAYQRSQAAQMASEASRDGHVDASAGRELVYCHACSNEWPHDDHGLICPRCQSDITEIVCGPGLTRSLYTQLLKCP